MKPIRALLMRTPPSTGSGSQRQLMVLTRTGPIYVNTSATADKQYALPGGAYLNEQS